MCALFSDPRSPEDAQARRQALLFTFLGTPVTSRGALSLPYLLGGLWVFFAWLVGKRRPERPVYWRLGVGLVNAILAQALEWGHNLSHAAAARAVGAPMDELYVLAGTPRSVYFINDLRVTPRQHIARALGGPLWNAAWLLGGLLIRPETRAGTAAREMVDAACAANAFIVVGGLTPYVGLDGGPLLKWGLVLRGRTPEQADAVLRAVDFDLGVALTAIGAWLLRRGRRAVGIPALLFGGIGLLIGLGLIREQ